MLRVHTCGRGRFWTSEENALLRTRYPQEGLSEDLLSTLGRGITSVRGRVRYLGLRLTPETYSRLKAVEAGYMSENKDWRGYGRIGMDYVNDLKRGAKRRGMEHSVLEENEDNLRYLDSLATDVCPLSGLSLTFPKRARDRTATASLDRIDPKQGYVRGNVRWIHKDINRIKWDMTDEVFLSFARDIAKTWPQ